MNRFKHSFLGSLLVAGMFVAGCGDDGGGLIPKGPLCDLAKECGIDCECKAGGIAEGNASISGVASVDAFFQSVINFQAKADGVSAGINAELEAIRGDFGIAADADLAAGIKAKLDANLEGSIKVEAEPARCSVDAQATLDAKARCEVEASPGSAMIECKGGCEVEASASVDCGAEAELKCTINPPMGMCEGSCQGSCEVMLEAAAECSGTCKGTCSGECSAYSDSGATQCAGKCDGMCMGSCETKLAAEAECSGTCRGECTFTPPDGNCEGGIRAKCEAMGDASVMCEGRCDGEFEPPMASAECEASVKAEASMNVECSPPRLAIDYELKAGLEAGAQAEFEAAIKNLQVRLPALLASVKKASLVVDAGEGLSASAKGAVKSAVMAASDAAGEGDLRVLFGLQCAVGELDAVGSAIGGASGRLEASVSAAGKLTGALGM